MAFDGGALISEEVVTKKKKNNVSGKKSIRKTFRCTQGAGDTGGAIATGLTTIDSVLLSGNAGVALSYDRTSPPTLTITTATGITEITVVVEGS